MPTRAVALIAAAVAAAASPSSAAALAAGASKLERVVVVMRHGVRPPTKAEPLPPGVARGVWPDWPVGWGELTPHGAAAVRALAAADRRAWAAQGLLPRARCPAAGTLAIYADSDQRTIATGAAVAEGLAPGCGVEVAHRPQGELDPLFSPVQAGATDYDPQRAAEAVAAHGPSLAERERRARPLLARLQAVLDPGCAAACPLLAGGTRQAPPRPLARPKLEGPLDLASTAAQVLLLQYAEGKPMAQVGFGRATAADVTSLSALHALEFDILARPPYVARRNAGALAARIRATLEARGGPALTVLVGHDTNIAALGGLLGLHWRIDGFAADDPSPGGELVFERRRAADGGVRVRVFYRSLTLEQIRAAGAGGSPQPRIVRASADFALASFSAQARTTVLRTTTRAERGRSGGRL